MHISGNEGEHWISRSPNSFTDAVEAWHQACRRACSENRNCLDRYDAAIDALITWLAENPAAARLYFGDCGQAEHPRLTAYTRAARAHLTRSIVEMNLPCGASEHATTIEFVVGAVRQLVREELRRETVDHARLAHRLTRFAPLFPTNRCDAHEP
ncbi:hypothetical protein REH65_16690 [Saccharopolyspora sp. ID03-671]|uniref:hypothetical protein n=1 Tax=Saccharopolyspora sp. ID03-671 TaxID=3073066 RepID=UPI00324E71F1